MSPFVGRGAKYTTGLDRPTPMAVRNVSQEFDRVAPVYDETRQPLDRETVEGLGMFLAAHRWSSVLEVGVGTGRIAQPLQRLGFRVVGVDASWGMLGRARQKQVSNLVRGSALHLPFPDRSVDVALFVHVLHVLDDASAGLREAGRVSRDGVLSVMDRRPEDREPNSSREPTPRSIIREVLAEAGYPDVLRAGPRARERRILERAPPTELKVLSDREVTEPLSRQIDAIEKRAYRHVLSIPPEDLARAVAVARERIGTRTITYRRSEMVVFWSRALLEGLGDEPRTPGT